MREALIENQAGRRSTNESAQRKRHAAKTDPDVRAQLDARRASHTELQRERRRKLREKEEETTNVYGQSLNRNRAPAASSTMLPQDQPTMNQPEPDFPQDDRPEQAWQEAYPRRRRGQAPQGGGETEQESSSLPYTTEGRQPSRRDRSIPLLRDERSASPADSETIEMMNAAARHRRRSPPPRKRPGYPSPDTFQYPVDQESSFGVNLTPSSLGRSANPREIYERRQQERVRHPSEERGFSAPQRPTPWRPYSTGEATLLEDKTNEDDAENELESIVEDPFSSSTTRRRRER